MIKYLEALSLRDLRHKVNTFMYHISYLRYSLLISQCGNVMASLFLLCLGRIHEKKTTNGDVKNCKCKFIKVDPYIKQYLTKADQELLEDYISLVNSHCAKNQHRLSILTKGQQDKFQDLILQIHMIEAGLI